MDVQSLTGFDIVVLAVVALSALLALARGAVREVLGLASWIGAIAVAFATFGQARTVVATFIQEPLLVDIATGALVLIVPLILFRVLASVLASAIGASGLGSIDRLLGFGFGIFRGVLIVCAGYLVLTIFVAPERQPVWIREAQLLPQVQEGARMVARVLPENARMLGELIVPPEPAAEPAVVPEAEAAERGYTAEEQENIERLLAPQP